MSSSKEHRQISPRLKFYLQQQLRMATGKLCGKEVVYWKKWISLPFRFQITEQEEVTYEEVVEGPQPHVIETGDSVKVKQVLDDATSEILIESGFQPNYFWENMKLFLMFMSCVFAMIAQFYPIPFPDSRPLLGFCCAMYFILSTVLQGMITYIDKDIILIGKADPVSFTSLTVNLFLGSWTSERHCCTASHWF